MKQVTLDPYALTDPATAYLYLALERTDDEREALIRLMINDSTALIEAACGGRRLLSRTYSGAKALRTRGDGSSVILSPQSPVTGVTSVKWKDTNTGDLTDLDLTGIDFEGARITIPNDPPPYNTVVLIECVAGYLRGFNYDHDAKIAVAEKACLRVLQISWQDHAKQIGRGADVKLANGSTARVPAKLPGDVEQMLWPLRRM